MRLFLCQENFEKSIEEINEIYKGIFKANGDPTGTKLTFGGFEIADVEILI